MKIGVIGTGNMGKALISGLLNEYHETISIVAFDQNENAYGGLQSAVEKSHPSRWFQSESPDVVILSVKPADFTPAMDLFSSVDSTSRLKPLWISIAAGISISALQTALPSGARICRVMPNTPAMIGAGMSAYSVNGNCSSEDTGNVEYIFRACGKVAAVPEKLMNAVTGLSGSGPAYVFLFIEALIEGGVTAGLPYQIARECALQTVIGAAKMAAATSDNPCALKAKVMSPAGTTASGLLVLEQHAFKHTVISAVVEAAKRSEQMGA